MCIYTFTYVYAHIAKDKNLDIGQFKHSNWLPVAPHN